MIEIEHLTKRYGPITAVDDVTFTVAKGEVLGFLGPNGAGKSTTMRMLTGYIQPDRGTVKVGGLSLDDDPVRVKALLGYLPENAPAYGDMPVQHFLTFIAAMRGLSGQAARTAIERVIEMCHLSPVRRQPIETLSKGYKHRTCFAQAVLHDPPVLVMDEPTDGLDPNQKHEVRNLISAMGKEKAIILSTHILEEVDAVCTRVIIIDKGKLVANDAPEALRARARLAGAVLLTIEGRKFADVAERLRKLDGVGEVAKVDETEQRCQVRLELAGGKSRDDLAARTFKACQEAGWQLSELRTDPGRLDEVFRSITSSEGGRK